MHSIRLLLLSSPADGPTVNKPRCSRGRARPKATCGDERWGLAGLAHGQVRVFGKLANLCVVTVDVV